MRALSFATRLRGWLRPPTLSDPEQARLATKLWIVVLGCVVVANVLIPLITLSVPGTGRGNMFRHVFYFDLVAPFCLLLIRRGHAVAASHLILCALLLIQTHGSLRAGGVAAPGMMMFLLIVSIAAILLNVRATIAYAAAVVVVTGGFLWAELEGVLPAPVVVHTNSSRWSLFVCYLIILAFVAAVAAWAERRSQAEAAKSAALREEAERQRRQSEEKYAKAFFRGPVMVVISRLEDGVFLEVNERALQVLGYEREELLGQSSLSLGIFTSEQRAGILRTIETHGHVSNEEIRIRVKGGGYRTLLLSANTLGLEGASCLLIVGVDITAQKALEEQLRQSQKMEAVGMLAGGIAHDYNNLLTAEFMQVSLLLESPNLSDEVREGLLSLQSLSQRSARLTRQLLTFSRKQPVALVDIEVCALVTNLLSMLERLVGEDIRVVLQPEKEQLWVHADLGMMEQVLTNLMVNARDAIGNTAGTITVSLRQVRQEDDAKIGGQVARKGDYVCLCVADSGCGMSEEVQARIFEPFFTTKPIGKGTGLGLATVFGIMSQHQGWVAVRSVPGKGSDFCAYFPSLVSRGTSSEPVVVAAESGGHATILLVEDEPAVRMATSVTLRKSGYKVLEAKDGPEALGMYLSYEGQIDALLTDTRMPGGLSGLELARQLRAADACLGVVVVSGYSQDDTESEGAMVPGSVFLRKPYDFSMLGEALSGVLRWRRIAVSQQPVEPGMADAAPGEAVSTSYVSSHL